MQETTENPIGFDSERVTAWLAEHVPGLQSPLQWTKLPGGHSNFTYRVDDAVGRTLVVRRPPLGELLPTAHDMRREFTVISALWPTPVPVPEPIAYTDDEEVTGAQFYVMGWVEGRSLYTAAETSAAPPSRGGPWPHGPVVHRRARRPPQPRSR